MFEKEKKDYYESTGFWSRENLKPRDESKGFWSRDDYYSVKDCKHIEILTYDDENSKNIDDTDSGKKHLTNGNRNDTNSNTT